METAYTKISEAGIDMVNDLLMDKLWDVIYIQPPQSKLLPREENLPVSKPIVQADTLEVDIKTKLMLMW